jgi:hypothetical protein
VSGHHRHAGGDLAARGWQAGAQPDHHWHARVSCIYSRQHLWTSSSTPTPSHVSGRLRPGHVEQYYKTSFRLTTPVLFVVQMHWCWSIRHGSSLTKRERESSRLTVHCYAYETRMIVCADMHKIRLVLSILRLTVHSWFNPLRQLPRARESSHAHVRMCSSTQCRAPRRDPPGGRVGRRGVVARPATSPWAAELKAARRRCVRAGALKQELKGS